MKKLLLLLAAALLPAAPALAQAAPGSGAAEAAEPGAAIVVAHTPDSARVAYARLARLLLAEGYPLAKTDKELGFIGTDYRASANQAVLVALRFVIVPEAAGSRLEVRGSYYLAGGPLAGSSPITLRGAAGSPAGIAWREMARLAAAYAPAAMAYRP